MSVEVPKSVNGYSLGVGQDGSTVYNSEDRQAKIICKMVSTSGGDVWNCMLYASDTPYGRMKPRTSTIAESVDDFQSAFEILDEKR